MYVGVTGSPYEPKVILDNLDKSIRLHAHLCRPESRVWKATLAPPWPAICRYWAPPLSPASWGGWFACHTVQMT